MPYAIGPAETLLKPIGPVSVNWEHPLNRELVYSAIFNNGAGHVNDLVRGIGGSLTNGAYWTGSSVGHGVYTDGSDDYVSVLALGDVLDGKKLTVAVNLKVVSIAGTTYPRVVDRTYNGQFTCYIDTVTARMGMAAKSDDGSTIDVPTFSTTSPIVFVGEQCMLAWGFDGTNIWASKNGSVPATAAFAENGLASSNGEMRFGQRADGTNRAGNWIFHNVSIWSRSLSLAELIYLSSYPYGASDNPRFL